MFTRIGASDRLLEHKSTFFMEMEETKAIVEQATPRSLAIIDELGRGTSTFDGFALASATLRHIVDVSECMCMFTTHYHMMNQTFERHHKVQAMRMACRVGDGG